MATNQRVIDRVNEILRQVSEENPSGRAKRYIGSGASKAHTKRKKRVTINNYPGDLYNQMQAGSGLNEGSYILYDDETGNNHFITSDGGAGRIGLPTGGCRGQVVGGNKVGKRKKELVDDPDFEVYEPYVKKTRKPRSDTGKSRQTPWTQFVKAVAASYGIPYNKALSVASELRKQGYSLEDLS